MNFHVVVRVCWLLFPPPLFTLLQILCGGEEPLEDQDQDHQPEDQVPQKWNPSHDLDVIDSPQCTLNERYVIAGEGGQEFSDLLHSSKPKRQKHPVRMKCENQP